jgi:hypothetical protein
MNVPSETGTARYPPAQQRRHLHLAHVAGVAAHVGSRPDQGADEAVVAGEGGLQQGGAAEVVLEMGVGAWRLDSVGFGWFRLVLVGVEAFDETISCGSMAQEEPLSRY